MDAIYSGIKERTMRYLNLGQTGLQVSEVGFGCIPIIRLSMDEAIRVLRRARERGITLFDTANVYLDSEEKIGRAFKGMRRQEVVLASKSMKRDRQGLEADLEQSLRLLNTDYLDLFQFHQVSQEVDFAKIISPDGPLEAALKAREAGKIRHLGVTAHSLEMAVRLVKTDLFSVIQFPFNFVETAAAQELHPLARERGMGLLAMKPFCGGQVDNGPLCFKFLRQSPDIIPLPGCDSVARVDEVMDLYQTENVVTPEDLAAMAHYRAELGDRFCRRCEYCQPCPQGVMITPAMLYAIVAHRMGPAKAAGFSEKFMETVRHCEECGECADRCPYNLPIPEMLKEYLELYDKHRLEGKE
jgi:predicted aldo/keto reductase-like oxidoreductase